MNKSGKVPAVDKRLTLNMRREIHQKLKHASVVTETTMGQIVEQLVVEHLDKIMRSGIRAIP